MLARSRHGSCAFGQIEADETFIRGNARNVDKDKRAKKITGRQPETQVDRYGRLGTRRLPPSAIILSDGEQEFSKFPRHGNLAPKMEAAACPIPPEGGKASVVKGGYTPTAQQGGYHEVRPGG